MKEDQLDLLDRKLTVGDLYLRMVLCLYKTFTIRKGIRFVQSEFVQVMKSVGTLALKTLVSNNPLLQKSEVLRIAGEFAFEYGFFDGHEDFGLCTDPTDDIYVTYPHRSIEEFFGTFGFLQALDDGKSIDDILGSDCEEPIFMVNPLVLRFCLWLLTQKCFDSQQNIYQQLVLFAAERIDFRLLDILAFEEMYPAMNMHDNDSLKSKFFKDILHKCQCVRVLVIKTGDDDKCSYEQADRVLGLMSSDLLSKLTQVTFGDHCPFLPVHGDILKITIDATDPETSHKYLNTLLPKYNLLKRNPQVHAQVACHKSNVYTRVEGGKTCDLSTLIIEHLTELVLVGEDRKKLYLFGKDKLSPVTLFASGKFHYCPQFTHLTLTDFHIDDSVPSALMKAVQNGDLPHLKRVELSDCTTTDCEWPTVQEFSFKTEEMFDSRKMQKLLSKLTDLTVTRTFHIDLFIPLHLEKLTVLTLKNLESQHFQKVNNIIKKGKLPNLSELSLALEGRSRVKLHKFLDQFDPDQVANLEKLTLQKFGISAEELEILSEKLTDIRLTELDLSWSSGLTGNLSVLFTHSLPTLNTLVMRSCVLNANDVQSLARANVEGKLPQLRHLDVSWNNDVKISDLFAHSAQWNQLKTLATADVNVLNVEPECLTSLEELIVQTSQWRLQTYFTRHWSSLKIIQVEDIGCIVDSVERGMFPSLTTVRCPPLDYGRPFFFKLLKANISVEPCVL